MLFNLKQYVYQAKMVELHLNINKLIQWILMNEPKEYLIDSKFILVTKTSDIDLKKIF